MNFELSQEQKILQKTVRDFCAREIIPKAAAWNEAGVNSRTRSSRRSPGSGVLRHSDPERYGGTGMGMLDLSVAVEEIARADASVGLTVASHNLLCMDHIYLAGNEEQRHKYLPRLSSGKSLGAWCLTEPDSGSDAGAARTRAIRREGKRRRVGLERRQELHHPGLGGRDLRRARLDHAGAQAEGVDRLHSGKGDARFAPWPAGSEDGPLGLGHRRRRHRGSGGFRCQRLGQLDSGFFDTGKVLDRGRIGIGAWAVGIGRAAFEAARTYAMQRVQFGKPISEFQAIRTMLADMATELDAARLLVWRAAIMQDNGQRTTRESSVAKYYASQAAVRACDSAVQIHGGYGYTREFPVERYLRDVKLAEIGEGTTEIQKLVIAREVLKAAGA
jgi:alkylation response protein AidB-like acyl-CoA dehydrogenase